MKQVNKMEEEYDSNKDSNIVKDNEGITDEPMYALFKAGQSKRIWGELYKVSYGVVILFRVGIFKSIF
jgi:nuclear GTP-binding protein